MTAPATTPESKTKSRRALLAGALGGLGAWAASAVGRASPVRAEGETIVVGGTYTTAESATILVNEANNATVFLAESASSGTGLWGASSSGWGVRGDSHSGLGIRGHSTSNIGVYGDSYASGQPAIVAWSVGGNSGLFGYSGAGSPPAAKPKTGVYGEATQDFRSRGVWGRSNGGRGVYGQATTGVGVYGGAGSGYALRTNGRVKMDKVSGVATIAAGNTSVTVTPNVNITSASFVLLTPKANIGSRGLWFTTNAQANTITIRISSSRSGGTKVAWLLMG